MFILNFEKKKKILIIFYIASSGHLLNFLVDKFFNLPYLSLVRYADHIACQRVEMLIEPEKSDFPNQLTEQQLTNLTKFFVSFKYAFRHQRLISLLDQFTVSKSSQDQNLVEEKSTSKLIIELLSFEI